MGEVEGESSMKYEGKFIVERLKSTQRYRERYVSISKREGE